MRASLAFLDRFLPKGWGDALRQFALFFVAYQGYQVVRGLVEGREDVAFANADRVVALERSLGAFFEPGLQQALIEHRWLIELANLLYVNSHFIVTTAFLVWLYTRRNEHFYFVRNMFLVAMALALIGYLAFPTAPPRLLAGSGFVDTIATYSGVDQDSSAVSLLVNPFAAVPSMHIAFSLMVAVAGVNLTRTPLVRSLWSAYPLVVFFVIVVTANHFWFDAAAGAAVACLAAIGAHQLARLRPDAWSWRSDPDELPA